MGKSSIVDETAEYIVLERKVNDEGDEYSDWELDSEGKEKYADALHIAEHYACFELTIRYKIYKTPDIYGDCRVEYMGVF